MNPTGQQSKHIVAQPIRPQQDQKISNRELWATVCYYYPQYTLREAKKLSARDIRLLLKIANQKEAEKMLQLTQIASAPHTKKGQGVKQLTEYYKKQIGK